MPSFAAIAPAVGGALTEIGAEYTNPERVARREDLAYQRAVQPIGYVSSLLDLRQKLAQGGKQVKNVSHDDAGNFVVFYTDGSHEIVKVGEGKAVYAREFQELSRLLQDPDPNVRAMAQGKIQSLLTGPEGKSLANYERFYQMVQGQIPYDPALHAWVQADMKSKGMDAPSVPLPPPGTTEMPSPGTPSATGPIPRPGSPSPMVGPSVPAPASLTSALPTARQVDTAAQAQVATYARQFKGMGQARAKAQLETWLKQDPAYATGGQASPMSQLRLSGYRAAYPNDPDFSPQPTPAAPSPAAGAVSDEEIERLNQTYGQ